LDASDDAFGEGVARLMINPAQADPTLVSRVSEIISTVSRDGDSAVLRFTNDFDARHATDITELAVDADELAEAAKTIGAFTMRFAMLLSAFATFMSDNWQQLGSSKTRMAIFLGSVFQRWIASASMCQVGKPAIRRLC
jgi:histidinol dehydrogenase